MTQLTKRLATVLAAIVLGTTLLASSANAAVPTSDPVRVAAVPTGPAHTTTVDGDRTDRDGEHHRRFCARLNAVLTRLVENNVITREQKLRIMEAFDCVPKPPTTTRPTTTSPRPAAAQ
jgi:hypothetical protein